MLRLIHQLPQATRFNAAVANDHEHVEAILEATDGQPQPYHPPLAEWDSAHEMLATIADRIDFVAAVTMAANGGTPPRPNLVARPKTAFGDVEQQRKVREHEKLVARVLSAKRPVESPPEDQ